MNEVKIDMKTKNDLKIINFIIVEIILIQSPKNINHIKNLLMVHFFNCLSIKDIIKSILLLNHFKTLYLLAYKII